MTRSPKGQPSWHPISALPLIGRVIDEGVEGAERQYSLLLEAKHRPRVLDDHTVQRTLQVYGETIDDLWVFDEQLARWSKTGVTPRQRAEVDRLILQQRRMREVVEDILSLAEELKGTTIEAVLARSDFDLGLEAVFGGRILDQRPPPPPPSQRAREASRTQRLNSTGTASSLRGPCAWRGRARDVCFPRNAGPAPHAATCQPRRKAATCCSYRRGGGLAAVCARS